MATREHLILAAIEVDRPGLVADLTGFIAEHRCNVEDSRLVVLGGFAGLMFLVAGEPAEVDALIGGLDELQERRRIRVIPRRVPPVAVAAPATQPRHVVEASAIDHQGIIHALADLVRQHGGNILELETTTESAPMSGEPLFAMRMEITLPNGEEAARHLEEELTRAARAQAIELRVHHPSA